MLGTQGQIFSLQYLKLSTCISWTALRIQQACLDSTVATALLKTVYPTVLSMHVNWSFVQGLLVQHALCIPCLFGTCDIIAHKLSRTMTRMIRGRGNPSAPVATHHVRCLMTFLVVSDHFYYFFFLLLFFIANGLYNVLNDRHFYIL